VSSGSCDSDSDALPAASLLAAEFLLAAAVQPARGSVASWAFQVNKLRSAGDRALPVISFRPFQKKSGIGKVFINFGIGKVQETKTDQPGLSSSLRPAARESTAGSGILKAAQSSGHRPTRRFRPAWARREPQVRSRGHVRPSRSVTVPGPAAFPDSESHKLEQLDGTADRAALASRSQ
jgi:hypothetical protein